MRHKLAVYGTLKKGFYNHYLLEGSKLLGEQTIPGFKMYSCGGYPAINVGEADDSIKVEVYEVNDPKVLDRVYQLEQYSGKRNSNQNWYDTLDVDTDWGQAEIFYFKGSLEDVRPQVSSGVWK